MKQFRIQKIKRPFIDTYNCKLVTYYQIQEFKKFLWFKPKWKSYKVLQCYGCDCMWVDVEFSKFYNAIKYLNGLKKIYGDK